MRAINRWLLGLTGNECRRLDLTALKKKTEVFIGLENNGILQKLSMKV